jgi:NAD+ kinase
LPTTSTAGSPQQSAEPVHRATIIQHGRPERLGDAVERVRRIAQEAGVELTDDSPDLAVVLGGDGTVLRALQQFLGTGVPVIGVNFGRVGFLCSMTPAGLEEGLRRAFAGDYVTVDLQTLDARIGDETVTAVNDVVSTSATLGRMVELEWSIGGEEMGRVPCDGAICSTPSCSTAYNLSNGGPVLVWGIDALTVTFVAPHSFDVRPVVVPRSRPVELRNITPDVSLAVIADGHRVGDVPPGGSLEVTLGAKRSLLATLPDATFVTRYRKTFT